jgi:preprotein translocase subunit YajC
MEPLIVLAVTFVLLWVLFILPQQRRVRAHQALVAAVEPGDEVILSAGIYGRVVELSADEMVLAVAPGVELRVARQAVLRRVEDARPPEDEVRGTAPADPAGSTPGAATSGTEDARPDSAAATPGPDGSGTDAPGPASTDIHGTVDERPPDAGASPPTDDPTDR